MQIRHRRTRIELVPIEIDPDAEMGTTDASSAALTDSAATVLCSSRPDKDVLAF